MSALIRAGAQFSQSAGPGNIGTNVAIARLSPRWVKVASNLLATAFTAAATTKSLTLFTLPAGGIIHACKIKPSVAFVGPSVTACTIQVGIAGTTNKYGSALDCVPAVSATNFGIDYTNGSESHTATTAILVKATATGANLSVLTAGAVDIWVLLSDVDG